MNEKRAIEIHNLVVNYNDQPSLIIPELCIKSGSLVACIGPNGGGKTTFLKSLVQLINYTGSIKIFDQPLDNVRKLIAYVPQKHAIDWDFPIKVRDVVMMGRYPHLNFFKWPSAKDYAIVTHAMQSTDIMHIADRPLKFLSGGQQQRVFLARALAQQAQLYLLDEPFNGVDEATETLLLKILKDEQKNGKTIIMVHHDLQTVHQHFDEVITINKSIIAHTGYASSKSTHSKQLIF